MTEDMDQLATEVERESDLKTALTKLITNLATRLHADANDPQKIRALAQKLKANNDALSDLVLANTEVDPSTGDPAETGATGDTAAQG